ncbi:alpha/beta hydrolase [Aspergillus stella-maris]|uniref:alpha/beta hydrolase n=1 Tax=Aspergillus stella-maris TaxID=1810926 RepID=UPI003CCE3D45
MKMSLSKEPNPATPITVFDLIQTGFTVCFRLPWVVGTTLLLRYRPWNTYRPPPLREHLFRHVMTCLGNHVPLPLWQWYLAPDTSGSNIKTSTRYGHIPHLFEWVQTKKYTGYWLLRSLSVEPIEPRDADIVILHAHGGGYVSGHPSTGAPEHIFLSEILESKGVKTAVFSLDYTLAPKAAFPIQRDEIIAAWDWLVDDLGVTLEKIVVMGDSAGGHLIMSLLFGLYERSKTDGFAHTKPAAAVLVSPWLNLHSDHPRTMELYWEERLHKRSLDTYCEWILRDASKEEDLLYGNFASGREKRGSWKDILPPRMLITAGSEELVFLYDIEDFVKQARTDGADVVLHVELGKNHAWQCSEALGQQGRLLALVKDKDVPQGIMPGYLELAMGILNISKGD